MLLTTPLGGVEPLLLVNWAHCGAQRLHKLLPDGFYLMPDLRNLPFRGTFLDSQCLRWAVRYTWLMSPGYSCVPHLCVNRRIIRVWPFLALHKYLLRGCPGILVFPFVTPP